jgi:hypothetical protein
MGRIFLSLWVIQICGICATGKLWLYHDRIINRKKWVLEERDRNSWKEFLRLAKFDRLRQVGKEENQRFGGGKASSLWGCNVGKVGETTKRMLEDEAETTIW